MKRNSAESELYPAHYNHHLLNWRRQQLSWTYREIARRLDARLMTVIEVFKGRASSKKVYPVARLLGLDWATVHDLTLIESDYPRALREGLIGGPQLIASQQVVGNSP